MTLVVGNQRAASHMLWQTRPFVFWQVNNLPYAESIEYGHSKQAAQGMVRINFIRIKSIIEQSAREHRV